MNWDEALRRIAAGEDVQAVLDEKSLIQRAEFVSYLLSLRRGVDLADEYLAKIKEIETGVHGARACWSALTEPQQRALRIADDVGGRLERMGNKEYRHHGKRVWPHPIRVSTIRCLCSRELMAWDGGAFDPEAVAVITERGRFVLKHGPS
jgi:hypothetical protein